MLLSMMTTNMLDHEVKNKLKNESSSETINYIYLLWAATELQFSGKKLHCVTLKVVSVVFDLL